MSLTERLSFHLSDNQSERIKYCLTAFHSKTIPVSVSRNIKLSNAITSYNNEETKLLETLFVPNKSIDIHSSNRNAYKQRVKSFFLKNISKEPYNKSTQIPSKTNQTKHIPFTASANISRNPIQVNNTNPKRNATGKIPTKHYKTIRLFRNNESNPNSINNISSSHKEMNTETTNNKSDMNMINIASKENDNNNISNNKTSTLLPLVKKSNLRLNIDSFSPLRKSERKQTRFISPSISHLHKLKRSQQRSKTQFGIIPDNFFLNQISKQEEIEDTKLYVDSYISKCYCENNSSIPLVIRNAFNLTDFSIFGICEGFHSEHSHLIAAVTKQTLTSHITNPLTYKMHFDPSLQKIKSLLIKDKNYFVLKDLFRCVHDEIKRFLKFKDLKEILSVTMVMFIGNDIVCVNFGNKHLKAYHVKKNVSEKGVEKLTSEQINNVKSGSVILDKEGIVVNVMKYDEEMKVILLGSEMLWQFNSTANVFKVLNEMKGNLEEKLQKIYNYKERIAVSVCSNREQIKEYMSYSIVVVNI